MARGVARPPNAAVAGRPPYHSAATSAASSDKTSLTFFLVETQALGIVCEGVGTK